MKNKMKRIIAAVALIALAMSLAACANGTIYDRLADDGYTVKVRYDAGNAFVNDTQNVTIVEVFNEDDVVTNSAGKTGIALLSPDDKIRGEGVFRLSKVDGTNNYFQIGWYRERTPVVDANGNALDVFGVPVSESKREQAYIYSGKWDFDKDVVDPASLTNGEMVLYAAWAPMDKKPDKKTRKLYEQAIDRASGVSRKRNMYRSTGISNTEIDFILNYINQANGGKFSSDSNETSNRPLSEILSEIEEEKYIPEEIREDMLTPNTRVIRNGRLSDSNRENQVEIMTLMYEMGIDVFNTYGKNMNKEAVKMVRSAVGGGLLTKKEKKKAKKRAKEEQKRLAHRRNNDAAMERALLRNRFSFDENGNSISMRMSDLIK